MIIYKNGKPNPKPWHKKILRRIKWKYKAIFVDFPRNLKCFFKNFWKFRKMLWNDRDWDWGFFHDIMRHKLSLMENHMREHDMHTNSWLFAKQMRYAICLLERISDDDYCKKEHKEHEEKWGKHIMDFVDLPEDDPHHGTCSALEMYTFKSKELGLVEQEGDEYHKICLESDRRRKNDFDHLYRFLRNNIEKWWC